MTKNNKNMHRTMTKYYQTKQIGTNYIKFTLSDDPKNPYMLQVVWGSTVEAEVERLRELGYIHVTDVVFPKVVPSVTLVEEGDVVVTSGALGILGGLTDGAIGNLFGEKMDVEEKDDEVYADEADNYYDKEKDDEVYADEADNYYDKEKDDEQD